jgi:hypothetical protein
MAVPGHFRRQQRSTSCCRWPAAPRVPSRNQPSTSTACFTGLSALVPARVPRRRRSLPSKHVRNTTVRSRTGRIAMYVGHRAQSPYEVDLQVRRAEPKTTQRPLINQMMAATFWDNTGQSARTSRGSAPGRDRHPRTPSRDLLIRTDPLHPEPVLIGVDELRQRGGRGSLSPEKRRPASEFVRAPWLSQPRNSCSNSVIRATLSESERLLASSKHETPRRHSDHGAGTRLDRGDADWDSVRRLTQQAPW